VTTYLENQEILEKLGNQKLVRKNLKSQGMVREMGVNKNSEK